MTKEQKKLALELFILSVLSLFLELFVIRWFSQDFRLFCVFKTFPLVTCFVGLGVGFALGDDKTLRYLPISLLYTALVAKVCDFCGLGFLIFPSVSMFQWAEIEKMTSSLGLQHVLLTILLIILLLAGPFALMLCIGARLGVLFNSLPPLHAYCVNVFGALCGTLLFTLLSFLGAPPWLSLLPAALGLIPIVVRGGSKLALVALPILASVALCAWLPGSFNAIEVIWSPYQRLDVEKIPATVQKDGKAVEVNVGYKIGANRTGYQNPTDVSPASVANAVNLSGEAKRLVIDAAHHYNVPYFLIKPKEVLILGAGSGNDVASALRNGAESVDAVDIDPEIIKIGKRLHPEHPYSSSKVQVTCDDARNYLRHCKKKYDLINFAGLDSFTIVGQGGSMTLCNYVYTKESLKDAVALLKPNGLLVLTFYRCNDWLSRRLMGTIEAACGYKPLLFSDTSAPFWQWQVFVIGPPVQRGEVKGLPAEALPFAAEAPPKGEATRIMTDDWPYIFVTPAVFDWPYLLIVAEVLLLSAFAGRKFLFGERDRRSWQMFFLGAAFMLLELQSISRLSLLYGSTWLTSAIVISGILIMILIANAAVIRFGKSMNLMVLYGCLFASILLSYFLPVNEILNWGASNMNAGHAAVTVATLLPICMAALIFATSFSAVKVPGRSLAFNLFGAVIGALLESLSTQFGVNAMVLIAALLYLGSFLSVLPVIKETESA